MNKLYLWFDGTKRQTVNFDEQKKEIHSHSHSFSSFRFHWNSVYLFAFALVIFCVFVYFGTHFINTWIQIKPNECKEPCKDDCLMWLLLLRLLLVPLPCTMCECVSFSFVCAALEHLFMLSILARWHYVKAVSNKKYIYHLLEKLFQLIRLWNGLVKFP